MVILLHSVGDPGGSLQADCMECSSGHAPIHRDRRGAIVFRSECARQVRTRNIRNLKTRPSTRIVSAAARCIERVGERKNVRGRSLVESRSSVCYFLRARGVAQPGSAPALGAGGRPFKSARPDRASSSGGKSNGLLSRGSGVRIPSGAPRRRIMTAAARCARRIESSEGGECSSVGRASDCGSGGRGFKSLHSPQTSCYVSMLRRWAVSSVGRAADS
jgi:hypothetical protein